jgi:hypothetical protein
MARILVQATLPHSRPNSHEFERVNGRFTLYMNAPPSVGLPYGSYPRLALAWLSTEAVRTRSREIELGPTFSSFMYKLGLMPVTGKRGTTSRLRAQLHRLFSTTIRCSYSDEHEGQAAGVGYTIAHKHQLWWSPGDPEQRPFWNSAVVEYPATRPSCPMTPLRQGHPGTGRGDPPARECPKGGSDRPNQTI